MGKNKKKRQQIQVSKQKIKEVLSEAKNLMIERQKQIQKEDKQKQILKQKENKSKIKTNQQEEIGKEDQQIQINQQSQINLFEMKTFEVKQEPQQKQLKNDQPQNNYNKEAEYTTQNIFKNNYDFLQSNQQSTPVDIGQRDDHLAQQLIKENLQLTELNFIQDKLYPKQSQKIQNQNKTLPIYQKEFEILESIKQNLITIICGETGCGKSTQIPKILLENNYERFGMIGVTQPRRLATITVANRVKEELQDKEQLIGHQVRFEKKELSSQNKIRFLTDGILLNEMMSDFLLSKYSVIVIDEAHERKVSTDLLISLLVKVVKIRFHKAIMDYESFDDPQQILNHPLRVIIMSATLWIDDFIKNQKLFQQPPPLVHIPVRTYPVDIYYNKKTNEDYVAEALKKVTKIHRLLPEGDVLVFLTGKKEIQNFCEKLNENLQKLKPVSKNNENVNFELSEESDKEIDLSQESYKSDNFDQENISKQQKETQVYEGLDFLIIPLYSKLTNEAQQIAFISKEGKRKIVVATNVAETSLTIDGLKYVVDCGKEKQKITDPCTGIVKFLVTDITQASAEQRKGRVGRTDKGVCYWLYSPAVYNSFKQFQVPEIMNTPFDYFFLQLIKIGIENPINFPLITSPDLKELKSIAQRLEQLNCIKKEYNQDKNKQREIYKLTELGLKIIQIPLLPKASLIIVKLQKISLLPQGILLAALLSNEELLNISQFITRENKQIIYQKFQNLLSSQSDLITQINIVSLYFQYCAQKNIKIENENLIFFTQSFLNEFCREFYMNKKVFEELIKTVQQLIHIFKYILSDLQYTELIQQLQSPFKISFEKQQKINKVLCMSLPDNIVCFKQLQDQQGNKFSVIETVEGRKVKFINSSFIKKDCQFYIYQKAIQIGEETFIYNITKLESYKMLLKIDQKTNKQNYIEFDNFSSLIYNQQKDKVYCLAKYFYGQMNWETKYFYMVPKVDQKTHCFVFLLAILKGLVFDIKQIQNYFQFSNQQLNKEQILTNKSLLIMLNELEQKQITNKESFINYFTPQYFIELFKNLLNGQIDS